MRQASAVVRRVRTAVASVPNLFGEIGRQKRAWQSGLRLLRDPSRLDQVFELEEAIARDPTMQRAIADSVRRDPVGAAALVERHRLRLPPLAELRAFPEGSLGRAYADHMSARGLDPASIPTRAAADEPSFIRAHLYETHDVWHVVTGFDTNVAGETGLQAFYAAQLHAPLARLLVSGGMIQAVHFAPDDWEARLDAITRGWTLGKQARPLFGVRWDALWDRPLAEVQRSLRVEPA